MQDIQTLSLFSHSHDIACMLQTTLSYSLSENSRTYQRQLLQRFLVYIQFFAVPTKQECGLIFFTSGILRRRSVVEPRPSTWEINRFYNYNNCTIIVTDMEDFTSFVTFRALKSVQYANGEETVTRLSQAVTANAIPLVSIVQTLEFCTGQMVRL